MYAFTFQVSFSKGVVLTISFFLRKDDFGALEPSISGKIMELHHDKHHATYVNSYNTQIEKLQEAQSKGDVQAQIAIQPLINFHGGRSTPLRDKKNHKLTLPLHQAATSTTPSSGRTSPHAPRAAASLPPAPSPKPSTLTTAASTP